MTETTTQPTHDALRDALAHAALFESLALCFRYPQADTAATLTALLAEVPPSWREALSNLSQRLDEVTESRFLQLFGSGGLCRDTESAYVSNRPMGGLLADLSGFYVAFGFPHDNDGGVPLDHIATELSFVSFLFAKEAHARFLDNAAAVEICQQGRGRFLQGHLGIWIGSFASTVAERAPDTLHAQAAMLAAEAVRDIVNDEWSKVNALPIIHHPPSVIDQDSCFACPAACGAEEEWA